MELVNLLTPIHTTTFFLLFIRISSFMAFLPFFNYQTIPMSIKAALSLWLTFLLYPITPPVTFEINLTNVLLSALFEVSIAFVVGMAIEIVFDILKYSAEMISYVIGFSMATMFDPNSGIQSTVIGQFITWVSLLFFLAIGGDHLEIMILSKTLLAVPFGSFFNVDGFYHFFVQYMYKYFLIGFGMAFPIIAISLFSDIIFGMIMKTMPQFNLLVVGLPVKIFISFIVLSIIIGSLMIVFKEQLNYVFNFLLHI